MTLESSEVSQCLDSLAITQEALDEEVANYNKLLASNQAKISSFITLIKQKQSTITNYNKQIYQITASTGVRESGEAVIPGCFLLMWNINKLEAVLELYIKITPCLAICVIPFPARGSESSANQGTGVNGSDCTAGSDYQERPEALDETTGDSSGTDPRVRSQPQEHAQTADRVHYHAAKENALGEYVIQL